MRCPFCGFDDSKVIDSRPTDEGVAIRRRRECIECGKRFVTDIELICFCKIFLQLVDSYKPYL